MYSVGIEMRTMQRVKLSQGVSPQQKVVFPHPDTSKTLCWFLIPQMYCDSICAFIFNFTVRNAPYGDCLKSFSVQPFQLVALLQGSFHLAVWIHMQNFCLKSFLSPEWFGYWAQLQLDTRFSFSQSVMPVSRTVTHTTSKCVFSFTHFSSDLWFLS